VEQSWLDHGFKLNYFNAITPETNTLNYLNLTKKRDTIEFSPTEIAVWYSHVEMWAKARNRPILIIEHDALLLKAIPNEVFYENEMVCLGQTLNEKTGLIQKLPGLAYYLTPKIAKKMVNSVKTLKSITWNSDATIHRSCNEHGLWIPEHVFQIKNHDVGTTIEHNSK
jgi:hypothetical protein